MVTSADSGTQNLKLIADRFFAAMRDQDTDAIGAMLADNVEWQFRGPVDVFPFYGVRAGREAAVGAMRQRANVLHFRSYVPRRVVIEDDRIAALIDTTAEQRATGRIIASQTAIFITVRDSQIVEFHALFDTFDLVEQMLGRPLTIDEVL